MSSRLLAVLAALGAFAALPAAAGPVQEARVSYDSGGVMLKGQADADWSYAKLNTLLLPGDTVWVDEGHMAEFEFQDGVFVRAADGAKLEVRSLPPDASFRGWQGPFYLQRTRASRGTCLFETPVAALNVAPETLVRVDVLSNGATTVSVRWGRVTVSGDSGNAVVLNRGHRSYIDPGYLPSPPASFDLDAADDFDSWNRDRTRLLAVGADVPLRTQAHTIGVHDLHSYGDFVYVGGRQYWRPTVVVDYVPYRRGYWNYVPSYGYTWVGSYPFCYTTTHYGRWTYHSDHGWLWYYTGNWAPAHCATVRYGDRFIWAPLDPWDDPVYIRGTASFVVDGVRYSVTASSYSYADALLYGPAPVHGVRPSQVTNIVADDVHIWNIYAPNLSDRRPDYGRGNALVRDYNPRRVIRGPETATLASAGSSVSHRARAVDRVASVSRSLDRTSFEPSVRRNRGIRTAMTETARTARVRTASVRRTDGDVVAGAGRSVRSRAATTLTGDDARLDHPNLHRRSSSAESRSRAIRTGGGRSSDAPTPTASRARSARPTTAPSPREGVSGDGVGVAPPRSRASVRSSGSDSGRSRSATSRPTVTSSRGRAASVSSRSGDSSTRTDASRSSTTRGRASSSVRTTTRPTVTSPRSTSTDRSVPSRARPSRPAAPRDRSSNSRTSASNRPTVRSEPSRPSLPTERLNRRRSASSSRVTAPRASASRPTSPRAGVSRGSVSREPSRSASPGRSSIFDRNRGSSSARATAPSTGSRSIDRSSTSSSRRSSIFNRSRSSNSRSGPARPSTVSSGRSRSSAAASKSPRTSRSSSPSRTRSITRGGSSSSRSSATRSRGSRRDR